MSQPTYSPDAHHLMIANILVDGYADGTYIEVERASDAFTKVVGSTGEVARVRLLDTSGSVKVSLLATSKTNDLFSALAAADEANGTGIGVLSLSDSNGTTIISASNCWVKKLPKMDFAKELPTREWEFECDDLQMHVGGNF